MVTAVSLIYKPLANGAIRLLLVCEHADIDPTSVTPVVINWIANAKRRSAKIIRGLSAAMAKYLAFLLIALACRGRVRCVPERVT